ncbi:MAG: hypothetical protein V9H26_17370 [Verrucomicrobiota bacterium]
MKETEDGLFVVPVPQSRDRGAKSGFDCRLHGQGIPVGRSENNLKHGIIRRVDRGRIGYGPRLTVAVNGNVVFGNERITIGRRLDKMEPAPGMANLMVSPSAKALMAAVKLPAPVPAVVVTIRSTA